MIKKRIALMGFLFLFACAPNRQSTVQGPVHASRVLVLPPHFTGKTEEGALLMRRLVARSLASRGYVTVPEKIADQELQKLGVKDPALLTPSQLQSLAALTGADSAAVIDLTDFASVNRGFSFERRVGASVRLIDALSGKVLWQNADQEVTQGKTINPTKALYEYVKQWGSEQFEKATQSPLYAEASALTARLFKTLPTYNPS